MLAADVVPARAHDVTPVGTESIPGFVWLGFTHMLTGWDHTLSNAGVEIGRLLAVYLVYLIGDMVVGFADWSRIERRAFAVDVRGA
jgi:hypothetical protein